MTAKKTPTDQPVDKNGNANQLHGSRDVESGFIIYLFSLFNTLHFFDIYLVELFSYVQRRISIQPWVTTFMKCDW